jgi:hypothetical protein
MPRFLSGLLVLCCLLGGALPAVAGQAISPKNPQRCVEYYVQDGKEACNTHVTQVSPDLRAALPVLPIAPVFDGRHWKLNWWNQQTDRPMMEYGLNDEPVGAWTELVTTQFYPGLQRKATPQQFMSLMIDEMRRQGFQPQVNIISSTPGALIYEFIITGKPSEDQHEIQRIWSSANGMYVIHYASRPTMSEASRKQWIGLLAKAKPLRN